MCSLSGAVCQEPARAGQPLAPDLDQALQLSLLHFEQFVLSKIPLRQDRTAEPLMPALYRFARRPGIGQRLVHMQHGVAVAGHEGIAADFDGKDLSQLQQAFLDPAAPVLEGTASECILAEQEGAAHAARDTVVVGSSFQTDQRFPWLGHGGAPFWLEFLFRSLTVDPGNHLSTTECHLRVLPAPPSTERHRATGAVAGSTAALERRPWRPCT